MSTNYKINMNYDNDKKVYVVPVLPEEIEISVKGQTSSVDIDRFGEVLHKARRDAITIKFSSYFPAKFGSYCSCSQKEFKNPKTWHSWLLALEQAAQPCHFVITGSPLNINIFADVISYTGKEVGGDPGTIQYTVQLKEHRTPTIKTYKKAATKKVQSTPAQKRTNNAAQTNKYKVVNCSWLNCRTGPNARIIQVLKAGTVLTTDNKWNGSWLHVYTGKQWGYCYKSYLKKV